MNKYVTFWIPFRTILTKEFFRFIRIWVQTILPPAVTILLYFIIFGELIGERIGEMDGYPYIDFIVPGLILMTVITSSYANVVSSVYQAKFGRYIEELLISPIPNWIILIGYISGGVIRGILVGAIVTVVSMFFTNLHINSYFLTLLIFFLTSVLFSLGGFINAIYARSFDDIAIIPNFILTPLTYLGGVFYSVQLLPDIWQRISLFNPILYMINAFRYGLIGISDISIITALTIIVILTISFLIVSLYLLSRGIGIKN